MVSLPTTSVVQVKQLVQCLCVCVCDDLWTCLYRKRTDSEVCTDLPCHNRFARHYPEHLHTNNVLDACTTAHKQSITTTNTNTNTQKISLSAAVNNRPGAPIKLSVVKCLSKQFGFEFKFKNNSASYGVHMWRYAVPGIWTGKTEARLARSCSSTRLGVDGCISRSKTGPCARVCNCSHRCNDRLQTFFIEK